MDLLDSSVEIGSVGIGFEQPTKGHASMTKDTVVPPRQPGERDLLSTMVRDGDQRLIAVALQAQFAEKARSRTEGPLVPPYLCRAKSPRLIDGIVASDVRSAADR